VGTRREDSRSITGINVTPFVDIALVLLIIFMVTARYIVAPQAIPLSLPRESPASPVSVVVSIAIDAGGQMFAETGPVDVRNLVAFVRQRKAENPEVRVIIMASHRVNHGRVVRVIDLVRQAGVTRITIQSDVSQALDDAPGLTL